MCASKEFSQDGGRNRLSLEEAWFRHAGHLILAGPALPEQKTVTGTANGKNSLWQQWSRMVRRDPSTPRHRFLSEWGPGGAPVGITADLKVIHFLNSHP